MKKNVEEEFIATVSHELRTPLTSIRGFSQTLLSSWDKLEEENKKKFVKIIEEQSNRLINLVENILTVSKINSDKPVFREVDVNLTIEKILQLIAQKYSNYKFKKVLNKSLPTSLLDEEKLQQVLTNLLDNACKYSLPGSTVIITTDYYDSDYLIIKVKDSGVGIPLDKKDEIFNKFTRLENHLTSKTQGNGLGLYITKNLVELMNGSISVNSETGKWTEFSVLFPFYTAEEMLKCSQQF